ncbi:MAG TPA: 3-hydroxyacyl-CoA dehydrogenase NAD-binding domain-containing protein [Spirochaetota bacterium]|nr:3-hydroxyacyl-CoA dehydrogenase NAD-binding domain-containing protein [Spirochaetota bacterium]
MKYINYEKTENGIAVITMDCPGTKVNVISSGLMNEVETILDAVDKDSTVKGAVLLSAKEDNFIAGADLFELGRMKTVEEVTAYVAKGHSILNRIEEMKIPVAACINGHCLGGGLEVALACHYRMAVNSPGTLLGLPEVNFGLLPAGGGCQRLTRLIGLTSALPMMLKGKIIRAKKAKRAGIVDELIPLYGVKDTALKKMSELIREGKIHRKSKRSFLNFLLESNPLGRAIVFSLARKTVTRKTYGCYPAPYAIIDAVEWGLKKGKKAGLLKEIELFGKIAVSHESESLISLFAGMTGLKKNPKKNLARRTGKLAVIGTGLMGQGIAAVSTPVCDTILMKDRSLDASASGMKEIWKGLSRRAKSGAVFPFERDVQYGKLVPCDDYTMFKNTDIVVEAVFEDLPLKRKILADVESATDERTIFASNTSAIPITDISKGCRRPGNVIGMHYFSPVPKMPLLEIITTSKTAPWVTASALDLGIAQGKTCIVVKDGPGFYTTRILAPMLNEVMLLLEEGAVPDDIDRAMRRFGYPVGPAALIDEIGIDVGAHVTNELGPMFAERGIAVSTGIQKLLAEGYMGKKNRKGFYLYDSKKKKGAKIPDEKVYSILGGKPRKAFDTGQIQQRVSLMMVNEALLCLEEGIISSQRDGDIGAVFGLGFPPFHGGPFRYIDHTGGAVILDTMNSLEKEHGIRFRPAKILTDMVKKGKRFYNT